MVEIMFLMLVWLALNIVLFASSIKCDRKKAKWEEISVLFKPFYALSVIFLDKTGIGKRLQADDKIRNYFSQLYVSEKENKLFMHHLSGIAIGIMVLYSFVTLGCVFSFVNIVSQPVQNKNKLLRERADKDYILQARMNTNGKTYQKEVLITVKPEAYSTEELKIAMDESSQYIEKHMLGENESLQSIESDLLLMEHIPDTDVAVEWDSSSEVIDMYGQVNNTQIREKEKVILTATLSYQAIVRKKQIIVWVLPKKWSLQEKAWKELDDAIAVSQEKNKENAYFILPQKTASAQILWSTQKGQSSMPLLLLGTIAALAVVFVKRQELEKAVHRRNGQMLKVYPEVVNKLLLLLGGGMSVKSAWYKLADDYEKRKNVGELQQYTFEEILYSCHEMEAGMSEIEAYSQFGKRCGLAPYIKLSTLLIQNITKGTKDLRELLECEAGDALINRREYAKKQGEEAGTKLLLPMMMLLCIVFIVIMVPAILTF